ncbi:hypothetical protein KC866_00365 [Patescibacteria group bacterium]|nr:hypothetical protein [Patescibacteria group bacterium]
MRDQMKALLDRVVETKDTSLFKNLYKQANKCFRDTMKKADTLAKEEPDTENFETFIQLGRDLMYYWTFGASMAEFVDEYIIEHASREHIKPSDVVGYVDIPETELMRQQSALREFHQEFKKRGWLDRIDGDRESLIHDIQQDKKLYKKLEKHMYEYGWIEMLNYVGDVITFDRFLTIIGGVGEEQKPQEKKKVSDTFNFILNIASYIGYARQAGAEYSSVFSYKLHDYLKATAEKINVSYSEMLNLTPEEIILALSNNLDPQPLLQRRANRNWLVWWDKHQHAQVVDDSDIINKLYEKMVPIIEDDQRQLVGQTGNKGKVVGKVSVIMATEDFGAFKEGNILVTTMTTPDFVVLMQKASAIVTDIGGLLSHASIVSRELGKPCVIGTKFATQILKDGDMVEVDADNGVVKILEK